MLAPYFNEVFASDISQKQLDQAIPNNKIRYATEPSDACSLPDKSVDLITVAQALHWFHFEHFFAEAKRVLKPGGIIATFAYGFLKIDEPIEKIIEHFYKHVIGSYWDAERRHVENEYKDIPFPFDEIAIGKFEVHYQWSAADLLGYLSTWSAVQHHLKATGLNPITLITDAITLAYGNNKTLPLSFPVFTKVGR
ncbi:MAG: methyltransferase domain-containing protein, partial [Bacteroidota bacterium]|nr:methyltransferase domain-containing protein [Bacteroidota bacterium]